MRKNAGLIKLDEGNKFKNNNLLEWKKNSPFWLKGEMQHIRDVKHKTLQQLMILTKLSQKKDKIFLIDVGCGEGWLYRAIKEMELNIDYVGIDFNKRFINELTHRFTDERDVKFIHADIEEGISNELLYKADIVVNAFNFFEIPNLEKAMYNTARLLKKNGILLVITIDPIMQLLAISKSYKDFLNNLYEYSLNKKRLAYRKRIVVGQKKTERTYFGILYSLTDFIDCAKVNKLKFLDFDEVINPEKPTPQIYQFISFKKKNE